MPHRSPRPFAFAASSGRLPDVGGGRTVWPHASAKPRRSVRRTVRRRPRAARCSAIAAANPHRDKKLTRRRWASRQWICCVLDFKDRQRDVWGRYYTELFFLDEVTALRRRPPAVLRMPAQGRGGFRRAVLPAKAEARARRRAMDDGAARRAARRQSQAPAPAQDRHAARWRDDRARRRGLRGARQAAAALDAVGL